MIIQNFTPSSKNHNVHIANGSLSKVTSIGSVVIFDTNLESILLVPNLDYDFFPIRKLTQEKNCVTKFFANHGVFHNLSSG